MIHIPPQKIFKKHLKKKKRHTSYIPFAPESNIIFAFEWQNPKTRQKQYFQTVMLQEFKNSPIFFGETAKGLKDLHLKEGSLPPKCRQQSDHQAY